ncbi:Lipoate-protein ligase A [Grifola frondosa]|uniref:Putative lipoate-protein ligase A n=1 Tax=Grifola frondosa TaxID=5627 RepID=A0A1C7M4V9_GRIFR|nr:Lipoate-protein ligase A [Grifola frondosa]
MLSSLRYVPKRPLSSLRHATIIDATSSPNHAIYVSKSVNPYFNLSFEDWLFRHKPPEKPLLLLYRDQPCVVIGRNQNPWKEVNLSVSRKTGIPFIRRHSGGGTVYHDLGNTNFSIHLPRTSFDRHATARVVLRALRSIGVDANVNDRNDICLGKEKISPKMPVLLQMHLILILETNTCQDMLGDLLRTNKDTMETKGVASVRSPVLNLQKQYPNISHSSFVDAMITAFCGEYDVDEQVHIIHENDETINIPYIHKGMTELPSWDWAYGQTPEFLYSIQHSFIWGKLAAEIHSKHGIILACSLTIPQGADASLGRRLQEFVARLEGQRYGLVDENVLIRESGVDDQVKEVWEWLKSEMDA